MTALTATYSVVLRSGLPAREEDLLKHLGGQIHNDAGEILLHFMCTKIDLSHHFYIEMETFKTGDEDTHPVRIPHHYVLLISGDESRPSAGFMPR